MARKISTALLRIVSVLFILGGVFTFTPILGFWGAFDHPASLSVLYFSFGSACILLGIISWKRADCFRSTLGAFLLLLALIIAFSLACIFFLGVVAQIEVSGAPGASEMDVTVGIIEGVLVLAFLGATFLLTFANKEKSGKRVTVQTSGRYVIDPRDYRTDHLGVGCLIAFWLIWAPVTAITTYLAYTERHPFFFIWLVFGYVGTISIPVSILFKNRKQIIEAAGDSVVVYETMGYPWSKVRMHKQNLQALTLEHYEDHDE
jgi:hypothetical protein